MPGDQDMQEEHSPVKFKKPKAKKNSTNLVYKEFQNYDSVIWV